MSTTESRVEVADVESARATLSRATDALLSLQHADGYWKGELETNVTMDAEDLFLREFLGISDPKITAAAANWIRASQRDDGTWSNFYGGTPDLSTTIEAYWALKLAGDGSDAPHMQRAARFIVDSGGLERSRVFTRIWMALFGLWSWDELPALPPEVILLPST
ncbi:MAG: squalene--hopene cyclase, partial [Ilumatobacteraceae bacterium]